MPLPLTLDRQCRHGQGQSGEFDPSGAYPGPSEQARPGTAFVFPWSLAHGPGTSEGAPRRGRLKPPEIRTDPHAQRPVHARSERDRMHTHDLMRCCGRLGSRYGCGLLGTRYACACSCGHMACACACACGHMACKRTYICGMRVRTRGMRWYADMDTWHAHVDTGMSMWTGGMCM